MVQEVKTIQDKFENPHVIKTHDRKLYSEEIPIMVSTVWNCKTLVLLIFQAAGGKMQVYWTLPLRCVETTETTDLELAVAVAVQ